MKKISKRYKKLLDLNKDKKLESVEKIIDTVKSNSNAKFVESVDLSLYLKKVAIVNVGEISLNIFWEIDNWLWVLPSCKWSVNSVEI